jgi:hypothetical protein
MDEEKLTVDVIAGQLTQKVRQRVGSVSRQAVVLFELSPCPTDRPLGADVESVRVEESPLVVVAEDHDLAFLPHELDALAGIRPVADDVAQTIDGIDLLPFDILEHGLERLEVAVDIADDGPLHSCRPYDPADRISGRMLVAEKLTLRTPETTVKHGAALP